MRRDEMRLPTTTTHRGRGSKSKEDEEERVSSAYRSMNWTPVCTVTAGVAVDGSHPSHAHESWKTMSFLKWVHRSRDPAA
jgi:hypothetical protein